MRTRFVARAAVGMCVLLSVARAVSGQTTVAVNYDPLLHELTENSAVGAHGDIARFFGPIAAMGDVGINHFDQATVITLAPGVRYAIERGISAKIQPAVQLVAGLWHCRACEANEFFVQPGATVDYAWASSMKFRFQFDVRRIFFDFGGETAERVGVGVVWDLK